MAPGLTVEEPVNTLNLAFVVALSHSLSPAPHHHYEDFSFGFSRDFQLIPRFNSTYFYYYSFKYNKEGKEPWNLKSNDLIC